MLKLVWVKVSLNRKLTLSWLAVCLTLFTVIPLGVPFGADQAAAVHTSQMSGNGGDTGKSKVKRKFSKSARTATRREGDEQVGHATTIAGHESRDAQRRSKSRFMGKHWFSGKKNSARKTRGAHESSKLSVNRTQPGISDYGIPSNLSSISSVEMTTATSVPTEELCESCRSRRKSGEDSILGDQGVGGVDKKSPGSDSDSVRSLTWTRSPRDSVDAETQTEPLVSGWRNWWRNLRLWKWASTKFGPKSRKAARARYEARERFGVTEALAENGELEKVFPQLRNFRVDPDINVLWEKGNQIRKPLDVPRASVPIERIVHELKTAGHGYAGRGVGVVVNRYGQILKSKKGMPEHEEFIAVNQEGQIYFINLARPNGFARANQFRFSEALEYQMLLPIDRPYRRAKVTSAGVGGE